MPSRAGGFCIYNDVALAIARARAAGLRVMYIDLDVHHGDGVEAIHAADPGVLTVSIHESGRYLFPGTGFAWEIGEGDGGRDGRQRPARAGDRRGRLAGRASRSLVPELAAAFGPDIIVSQHGCDTHATDPLAHLDGLDDVDGRGRRGWSTSSPIGAPAAAGSRRAAAGTASTGSCHAPGRTSGWRRAHRDAPDAIPEAWRERWAGEAARYGVTDLPRRLDDDQVGGRWQEETTSRARRSRLSVSRWCRTSSVSRSTSGHGRPSSAFGRTRTAAGPDIDVSAAGHAVDRRRARFGDRRAPDVRAAPDREPVTGCREVDAAGVPVRYDTGGGRRRRRRARGVGADVRRGARAGRCLGGAAGAAAGARRRSCCGATSRRRSSPRHPRGGRRSRSGSATRSSHSTMDCGCRSPADSSNAPDLRSRRRHSASSTSTRRPSPPRVAEPRSDDVTSDTL